MQCHIVSEILDHIIACLKCWIGGIDIPIVWQAVPGRMQTQTVIRILPKCPNSVSFLQHAKGLNSIVLESCGKCRAAETRANDNNIPPLDFSLHAVSPFPEPLLGRRELISDCRELVSDGIDTHLFTYLNPFLNSQSLHRSLLNRLDKRPQPAPIGQLDQQPWPRVQL